MNAERGTKGIHPMPDFGRGDRVLVRPLTAGVRYAIGGECWGEIISVYTDTLGCGPDAVLEWELAERCG